MSAGSRLERGEAAVSERDFAGKVAIVTGGTSGIGAASVRQLADRGAQVVFCGTSSDKGKAREAEWRADGLDVTFQRTDVSIEAEVEACVATALDRYGRLDFAINSAGIYQYESSPVTEMPLDYWNRMLAVNLTGIFLSMKHEISAMLRNGGGSVVNIASGAALKPVPQTNGYVTAKHGMVGLTKTAALDFAKQNVRVNLICPGLVDTEMTVYLRDLDEESRAWFFKANAQERIGLADEIASACVWLCTPGAAFTTGVVLPIDGGFAIK